MTSTSKKAMDKIVKYFAKNQNKKKKLNAGEIREAIKLVILGSQDLTHNESRQLVDELVQGK